jgi:hypothetical protein
MYTFVRFLGTIQRLPRDYLRADNRAGKCNARQTNSTSQSEGVMADVCLGLAVAGVNTLVALGVCIAFM